MVDPYKASGAFLFAGIVTQDSLTSAMRMHELSTVMPAVYYSGVTAVVLLLD